jgi:cell division protein FtsI/penicillin-binding protein 2
VISNKTAVTLQKMLKNAVNEGTGKNAFIDGWGAAGKTGSAQTGWEKDGEIMVHGWFAGYFPADNPKYVCVILAQNGKTGALCAAPVFKAIGDQIKKLE